MCLNKGTGVSIKNKIGYVVAVKDKKVEGNYRPLYYSHFSYTKGERSRARWGQQNGSYITSGDVQGGFYFFASIEGVKVLYNYYGKMNAKNFVVLKCLFEDVFEKGLWEKKLAYRAKYRTILEEVQVKLKKGNYYGYS